MNIEDMRAWVATYESGSLHRASIKLNLTQPAVTKRIQRLESSLGVTLLDRRSKPARPTPVGEKIFRDCLRIVGEADDLKRFSRTDGKPAGDLRIGVSFGVIESILGPSIDQLRAAYPGIRLHITGGRNATLISNVHQTRLDAAIIVSAPGKQPDTNFPPEHLGQESVSVVVRKADSFADEIDLKELAGRPWIINPDGCRFRNQLEEALDRQRIGMDIAVETWGLPFLVSLVARGMGVGLTTARSVLASPYADELKILQTRDFAPILDVLMIRGEPREPLTPILDTLAAQIGKTLGET